MESGKNLGSKRRSLPYINALLIKMISKTEEQSCKLKLNWDS